MLKSTRGVIATVLMALMLSLGAAPAQAGIVSEAQEIAIGQQAAAQIEAQYPVYTEIGMNERLNRLAGQLLTKKERSLPYRFRILDIPEINAMALPGGFVYVTRGLLEQMPDEEAAFVIAHELQHIEQRHSVKQIEADLYKQIGLTAAIQIFSRGQISQGQANLIQLADMVLSNRYTQAMEREADREGILMMAAAGIDPLGAVASLRTLERNNGGGMPGILNAFLGTHPLTGDRIKAAETLVATIDFDRTPAVSANVEERELEVAIAPAVPDSRIPPTDSVREAQMMLALETGRYALAADPSLMRQARWLQANAPTRGSLAENHAVVVMTHTQGATEKQVTSQLLQREIPLVIGNRTFENYGVSVVRMPDGKRRVILLLS